MSTTTTSTGNTDRIKRRKYDEVNNASNESNTNNNAPSNRGGQYHCDYCRQDITTRVRIKCAECSNFDLCVECFSSGVEVDGIVKHKSGHSYQSTLTEPIFDKNWGADEELLLLEAIELYGYGNWSDITDHVGNNKTKQQVESHFIQTYLGDELTVPLVFKNINLAENRILENSLVDVVGNQSLVQATTDVSDSKDYKIITNKNNYNFNTPIIGAGNQVGYLPHRGDFEVEWNNDFEQHLADTEFRGDDTASERDLKLRILQLYNRRLDQREERKKFILAYGLLFPKEKKRSKEEKEVYNNLKPFARFHAPEEHEQLIKQLTEGQRIRKRIDQLQMYRMQGIRTLSEAEKWESEKKKDPYAKVQERKFKKFTDSVFQIGPESEQLSALERQLCTDLSIKAKEYLKLKDIIIEHSVKKGLVVDTTSQPILIDVMRKEKVIEFFISSGWMPKDILSTDI